jgi:hypothetical protein
MMKVLAACVLLILPVGAAADEIQTKDGKRFEFKALTDEGDSWELTTPQGTKVSVKKSDFYAFIPSGLKESPLTGATFAFDKKRKLETVDLMSRIDLKKSIVVPTWRFAGGALVGTGVRDAAAKIETSYTPPEEYDLTLVLERKETGAEVPYFVVGLVGGGKQFTFILERNLGSSGLWQFKGQNPLDNGLAVPGQVFEKGKARTFVFLVRREAFIIQLDGKDWFTWKPDWTQISFEGQFAVPSKSSIFFCVGIATYNVTRAVVTAPKEKQ